PTAGRPPASPCAAASRPSEPTAHDRLAAHPIAFRETCVRLSRPSVSRNRESGGAAVSGSPVVGFVGLGSMGSVLAANLVGAGHDVVAHDRDRPERMPGGPAGG